MGSLYDHRWFIGGGGRFLRLNGRVKVAVSQFSPLEKVAMEYFWIHFVTDKLDIATSMRPWRDILRPSATLRRLENYIDF